MAIDIRIESLVKLSDVPAWCEENVGNRVHRSTVHRWRLRGVRGIKLATLLVGGIRYTSAEALAISSKRPLLPPMVTPIPQGPAGPIKLRSPRPKTS